jgi:cytochrome c oxidase assembly protein subunit 11
VNTEKKPVIKSRYIWIITAFVLMMFGFGFALVPFYNVFCEWTGLNGKVKTEAVPATAYVVDQSRELPLEFVTTLNGNMPLEFRAEKARIMVHPGQYYTVKFFAKNTTDHKLVGRAIPSIAPGLATQFLKKTECFCFSEQEFEPGIEREMPVRFVIDPSLPALVKDMTLSYTFFDITNKQPN